MSNKMYNGARRDISKKTKKNKNSKLHHNDVMEIRKDCMNKIRYFGIGDYFESAVGDGYVHQIVKITPTDITYTYTDIIYFKKDEKVDKYKTLRELYNGSNCKMTFQYEKLFLINTVSSPYHYSKYSRYRKTNPAFPSEKELMKESLTEKDYMKNMFSYVNNEGSNFFGGKHDNVYYILIKVNSKHYVSLSDQPFEFDIPDDDEIIYVINLTAHPGYEQIMLIGRVNTYFIDDAETPHLTSRRLTYIANEIIDKYLPNDATMEEKIKFLYNGNHDDARKKPSKPYLIVYEKYHKKVFGKKIPVAFTKVKKIYDVLQTLEISNLPYC
jgi:hypothetical protein